jgi:hypothetical protein
MSTAVRDVTPCTLIDTAVAMGHRKSIFRIVFF